MKVAKPEVDGVQEKVKRARTQEEKMAANQEMMEVYKKYDINPMKSALGCLPVLIQMPVVMGLYFVLRYRIGGGIAEHPHFLWFNLNTQVFLRIIKRKINILNSKIDISLRRVSTFLFCLNWTDD